MKLSQRFLLIVINGVTLGTKVRYDGHKLYEIRLDRRYSSRLKREIDQHIVLDHYDSQQNASLTILVEPDRVDNFEMLLTNNSISHDILNVNVQRLIDDDAKNIKPFNVSANGTDFGWQNFYRLETIYAWLDHLAQTYSDLITPITIGTSYEGRPLKGVKLSHKKDNTAIFIEAGIHAKEWIGPAAATFILNQLLTSTDAKVQFAARYFDWIVFPVCNPDGYKYTFDRDRLWRKNRQRFGVCFGVDLNRNWNISWTPEDSEPCGNNYPGPYAFSAPEARNIAQYLRDNAKPQRIQTYLSFHSASQKVLFPYAMNGSKPPNSYDLLQIGKKAVEALANRYGKRFQVGGAFDILYGAEGTSLDWVYSELKIPIVYTYELRRSTIEKEEPDNFQDRFLLPVDQIEAAGWETLDSVVELLNEAKILGYYKLTPDSPIESTSHYVVIFSCIAFGILLASLYFANKYKLCWRRHSEEEMQMFELS